MGGNGSREASPPNIPPNSISSRQTYTEDQPSVQCVVSVPTRFVWRHGGRKVTLAGTFNNWTTRIPLLRVRQIMTEQYYNNGANSNQNANFYGPNAHETFSYNIFGHYSPTSNNNVMNNNNALAEDDFVVVVNLPVGGHQYKFVVDDEWRNDPSQPTATDNVGHLNNYIDVVMPPVHNQHGQQNNQYFQQQQPQYVQQQQQHHQQPQYQQQHQQPHQQPHTTGPKISSPTLGLPSSNPSGEYGQVMTVFEENKKMPPLLPPHLPLTPLNTPHIIPVSSISTSSSVNNGNGYKKTPNDTNDATFIKKYSGSYDESNARFDMNVKTILGNSPVYDPQQLPLPFHVTLNHVYFSSDQNNEEILSLAVTQRYKSKFATVVLYKPLNSTADDVTMSDDTLSTALNTSNSNNNNNTEGIRF